MRFQRNLWLTILTILSALIYGSAWVPPSRIAWISLLSYGIPIVLGVQILLLVVFLIFARKWLIYPLLSLVLGTGFLWESFAFSTNNSANPSETFSLLSYNTKMFRKHRAYHEFSGELIDQVIQDQSEIKCLQEFSTNARWKRLDIIGQMRDAGYEAFTFKGKMDDRTHSRGIAIFSKLPIVHRGIIWESPGTPNACIFVDVKWEQDTVRIYNTHLESMRLKLNRMKNPANYQKKVNGVVSSMIEGAKKREHQIGLTLDHCARSPHPYILTGDMNEIPYSYNYRRLHNHMSSSFLEAGNGFGFSFNSSLFFLRIDHHFHGPEWEASHFEVDRSLKLSDHFPTHARYGLSRDEP